MRTWYTKYYPESYLTGNITTVKPELNEADPSHCPHCNSNHSMWAMRDDDDLVCRYCGYPIYFYFNKRLSEFLEMNFPQFWIEEERKEGLARGVGVKKLHPAQRAKRIRVHRLARKKRHYANHRQELLAKSKAYNEAHKDEIRAYKTLWARDSRAKKKQEQAVMV